MVLLPMGNMSIIEDVHACFEGRIFDRFVYLSVSSIEYSTQRLHASEMLHTTNDEMLPETNPTHLQIHRLLTDPRIS